MNFVISPVKNNGTRAGNFEGVKVDYYAFYGLKYLPP